MGRCELCQEPVPDAEILDHLRVLHPDDYGDGPETWPDGNYVIETEAETVEDALGE